jgi:hypothetical protein
MVHNLYRPKAHCNNLAVVQLVVYSALPLGWTAGRGRSYCSLCADRIWGWTAVRGRSYCSLCADRIWGWTAVRGRSYCSLCADRIWGWTAVRGRSYCSLCADRIWDPPEGLKGVQVEEPVPMKGRGESWYKLPGSSPDCVTLLLLGNIIICRLHKLTS